MKKLQQEELVLKANEIRKDLLQVCLKNKAGHIAPSLSCVDLLVVLYYHIMSISIDPTWEERDRLVFSKAHGSYGLYSILSDLGYITRADWENFYSGSSPLLGCVERCVERGLEASTGSLGHGLPIATGIAFGAKLQGKKYNIYCITGDGEMQEGSNWEAIQFAVKHELSNLVLIIDNNKLQAMDFIDNVLTEKNKKNDLQNKMSAFGFEVFTSNGHDIKEIIKIFYEINQKQMFNKRPFVLILDTIKGYGLKCMENIPKFHFRLPTDDEIKQGTRYE